MAPSQVFVQNAISSAIAKGDTDTVRRAAMTIWLDWPDEGGTYGSTVLARKEKILRNCLVFLAMEKWAHEISGNILTIRNPSGKEWKSDAEEALH